MRNTVSTYHKFTAYDRLQMGGHSLDYHNQPRLYKDYTGLAELKLPEMIGLGEKSLWEVVCTHQVKPSDTKPDLDLLSQILTLGQTITAKSRDGRCHYRSTPSAGALYPNEIYAAACGIKGIENGLYYYRSDRHTLTSLRKGDLRAQIFNAAPETLAPESIFCSLFITGIYFRSVWKYRARAFRYLLLDGGHLLENITLAAKALMIPYELHLDFNDQKMAHLLGINDRHEVCLACLHLKGPHAGFAKKNGALEPLAEALLLASRVSATETRYPEIHQAYQDTGPVQALPTVSPPMADLLGLHPQTAMQIQDTLPVTEEKGYIEALFQRRSRRNFIRAPLSKAVYLRLVKLVMDAAAQAAAHAHSATASLGIGYLAGDIEGVLPGFYLLDPQQRKTACILKGELLRDMASACLDQQWLRHASLHFVFMTHLTAIDTTLGARAYRHAMLNAGRIAQTVYLGATALGMGCCGIGAFYDAEARNLLGVSQDAVMLYLVAAGKVKGYP